LGKRVRVGDRLLSIQGQEVRDELDLAFLSAETQLRVEYLRQGESEPKRFRVRKDWDESLGLEIEPLRARRCRNHCIFCFIDQNPSGLRRALYLKDEDFRLSFSHGHYITGTSLKQTDLDRIIAQRLSPLYISVHATDPDLRGRMLGLRPTDPARAILPMLRHLAQERLAFHTQVVLCPEWNDGAQLDRTLDDLEALGDSVPSVAVVPVGLTDHRAGLESLRTFTPEEARAVIAQLEPRQARHLEERNERWVLLADEMYLLADRPIPPYSEEERECQIENGVGMVANFLDGWEEEIPLLPHRIEQPLRVAVLTAALGRKVLEPVAERLNAIENLTVQLVTVTNRLFGAGVTVSGLLGGLDFDRALGELRDCDLALLPANALRPEDDRFLDDLTLEDLRTRHPEIQIEASDLCAAEWVPEWIAIQDQAKGSEQERRRRRV
jgi:putative radical SAM enzyme (TIGR03279 family)